MKVICISGKAQNGKDFTANALKEKIEEHDNCNVLITHYADLLKYICKTFFGWNGKKDAEGRSILQFVGSDVIRKNNPDYWVDFIVDILDMFPSEFDYVLIPDCRFPNEIEVMKEKFDCIAVRVNRPDYDNGLTDEQKNHISETALDDFKFDYELIYTGDISYLEEIDKFINYINER